MAAKSNVGVLTVFMDAITDQFHAGLNDAASAVDTFKGKLRGMNRTLSTVSAAVKGAENAINAFKAVSDLVNAETYEDINAAWVGIGDTLRSLPGPLGEVSSAIYNILLTLTGAREEMEALAEATREGQRVAAAAEAAVAKFQNISIENMHKLGDLMAGELAYWQNVKEHGKEAADLGKRRVDAFREQKAIADEMLKVQFAQGKYATLDEEYRSRILKDLKLQLGVANDIGQLRLEAIAAEVEAGKEALRLADQKKAADIAEAARKKKLAAITAAHAKIASLQKTRASVRNRNLAGGSNTFSSPMGTISLPSLNEATKLARKQVLELQTINRSINELNWKIAELSQP